MSTVSSNGLTLDVPAGWHTRTLFLDAAGTRTLIQVANFTLPPQSGFDPPEELARGVEERITGMSGGDALITLAPREGTAPELRSTLAIRDDDFHAATSPTRPREKGLAQRSFCRGGRCFELSVLFGREDPSPAMVASVNRILGTFSLP